MIVVFETRTSKRPWLSRVGIGRILIVIGHGRIDLMLIGNSSGQIELAAVGVSYLCSNAATSLWSVAGIFNSHHDGECMMKRYGV